MKKRTKKAPPMWDLPDWQIQIIRKALSDHELVMRLREHGGYTYGVMLDQVRANLAAKPK